MKVEALVRYSNNFQEIAEGEGRRVLFLSQESREVCYKIV
jgi:hypothetical protein